jgi:hypothetical protein
MNNQNIYIKYKIARGCNTKIYYTQNINKQYTTPLVSYMKVQEIYSK